MTLLCHVLTRSRASMRNKILCGFCFLCVCLLGVLRVSLGVDCEFSLSSIKLLGITNSESVVLSNYFPHYWHLRRDALYRDL